MNADAVIIGGGPAGSAAAITLAQAGRNVLLLERETGPTHKVCGEFLSHEALSSLAALGMDAPTLGALPIHALRLASSHRVSCAPLPFPAMALSRCHLDEALLQRASDLGVEVRRGARVFAARFAEGFWRIDTEDRQPLVAKNLFVATGKHDLPGRPRPKGKQTGFVGFKMHLRLTPQQTAALGGHIELMVFRGGYAGLTCVEDGIADLGWIAHRDELQRAGGIESLLQDMQRQCPLLAERLAGAHRCFPKPLAISPIPYGYVRRESQDGLWWLGDQAAVIPSFTGDGMSIALHSGRLAARMYLAGSDASGYQQALASQLRCQVAMATAFSRGLIWSPTRSAMLFAARIWPGSMAWLARRTRIAERIRT